MLVAAPASAQLSSVDAYGGQAAVLGAGKPSSRGPGGTGGGAPSTGGARAAPIGSSVGGDAAPRSAASGSVSSGAAAVHSSSGQQAVTKATAPAVSSAPARAGSSVPGAQTSAATVPFSGLDVLVLIAGSAGLLAAGVVIRRLTRPSRLNERAR